MRQHLFAIFKPKYSLLSFCFYKKANFNKPFGKKVRFPDLLLTCQSQAVCLSGNKYCPVLPAWIL